MKYIDPLLMLLVLESTYLYHAFKGIPAVRWVVELWIEKIRVTRVIVTEDGIIFYKIPPEKDTEEGTVLSC